jgi:nucleotide-binding universal stress UspA family protein
MKLLVAVDGSKNAVKATKYAVKLLGAINGDRSITLISVHDDTGLLHATRFVGKDVVQDYLRETADKDLADAHKVLERADLKHDMIIRTGRVAQEIVDTASKGKYDMIVMGSKGRSALKDLLIGSIAQRVLGLSKVPVLLV